MTEPDLRGGREYPSAASRVQHRDHVHIDRTPARPMTVDVRQFLADLAATRAAATPGEWVKWHAPDITAIAASAGQTPSGMPINPSAWVADAFNENDAACIVAEHNALPALTAALTAVLNLADRLDWNTTQRGRPAPGSHDDGVNKAQADAADRIRAAVAAAVEGAR